MTCWVHEVRMAQLMACTSLSNIEPQQTKQNAEYSFSGSHKNMSPRVSGLTLSCPILYGRWVGALFKTEFIFNKMTKIKPVSLCVCDSWCHGASTWCTANAAVHLHSQIFLPQVENAFCNFDFDESDKAINNEILVLIVCGLINESWPIVHKMAFRSKPYGLMQKLPTVSEAFANWSINVWWSVNVNSLMISDVIIQLCLLGIEYGFCCHHKIYSLRSDDLS